MLEPIIEDLEDKTTIAGSTAVLLQGLASVIEVNKEDPKALQALADEIRTLVPEICEAFKRNTATVGE